MFDSYNKRTLVYTNMKTHILSLLVFLSGSVFLTFHAEAQYIPLPPYQVQNVQANVLDDTIRITWDEAQDQDDGVVVGYKVYYGTQSVTAENQNQYDDDILVDGIETEYTLYGLEPGTYYIAVTARDDEDLESDNYSQEIQVSVGGSQGNNTFETGTPKVLSAQQIDSNIIEVTMSEPVVIDEMSDGFILQNKETLDIVPIIDTEVENEKVRLMLLEGMLEIGKPYQVIATAFVEDLDGTPVSSGITDTAEFRAQEFVNPEPIIEPDPVIEEPVTETEEPVIEEPVVAPDPIVEEPVGEDPIPEIEEPEENLFEPEVQMQDTTPPYDATNLTVDTSTMLNDLYVTLYWNKSLDVDRDAMDQIIYVRIDNTDWDQGYSIGKDLETIELDIDLDRSYDIKLVTIDEAGNVSDGTQLSFDTTIPLPKTGAESYFFVLMGVFIIGMAGFVVVRRRNRLY